MSSFLPIKPPKWGLPSSDYKSVPQADPSGKAAGADHSKCPEDAQLYVQRPRRQWVTGLLILTTLFFAILSTWLSAQVHHLRQQGSFAQGYWTDLRAAKHAIEVEETRFTGAPRFTEDGSVYVPEPPPGVRRPKYVGEPTGAIDHEWDLLHQDRYFLLSEEEAREAWGPGYRDFWSDLWGGYLATVDAMHSLHCLDHIRKSFYPDTYPPDDFHGVWHRDHCIDHLRQIIVCTADLTPIPSRYYKGIGHNYIDGDMSHTCRNWPRVRNWVTERFNGSSAVPPVEGSNFAKSEAWRDQLHGHHHHENA